MQAMDVFNIFCGLCSVMGLGVSIFTASKVIKISQTLNCNNRDDHSKVINKGKNNTYKGAYAGRDFINGIGESDKQK